MEDDHRRMPPLLPITAEGARMLMLLKKQTSRDLGIQPATNVPDNRFGSGDAQVYDYHHPCRGVAAEQSRPVSGECIEAASCASSFRSIARTTPTHFESFNSSLVPGDRAHITSSRADNGQETTQERFHKRHKQSANGYLRPGYSDSQPEDLSVASNVFDLNGSSADRYSGRGECDVRDSSRQTGITSAHKNVHERLGSFPSHGHGEVTSNDWNEQHEIVPRKTQHPEGYSPVNQRDARSFADCCSDGYVDSYGSPPRGLKPGSVRHGNIDTGCHYMTSSSDPNCKLVGSDAARPNITSAFHIDGRADERLATRDNLCTVENNNSCDDVREASSKSPQSQQKPASCIILDQHTPTQLLKWEKQIEEMTRNAKLNRGAEKSNVLASPHVGTPYNQTPKSYGTAPCHAPSGLNHDQQRSFLDQQRSNYYRHSRRTFQHHRSRYAGATHYQHASSVWERVSDDGSLYIKSVSDYGVQ